MYQITNLNQLANPNAYNIFLNNNSNSSYFHTIEFFNVLQHSKGFRPVSIIVQDNNNEIQALLLGELSDEISFFPFLTRRLIIYSKPLFNNLASLDFLIKSLTSKKYGLFIQIRSNQGFNYEEITLYQRYGFQFHDHLNAIISLSNQTEESILKGFKKDKIKGIRQAERKYGLKIVEFANHTTAVCEFYKILSLLYKKKRHSLKSQDYFYNLINKSDGHVKIIFAIFGDIPIATQLYIDYKNTITALYTATLNEHKDKHGGDYLIYYLLQECLSNKKQFFDFGGGGNPNLPYPPRDYKARFGTSFNNVGRLILPQSPLFKIAFYLHNKIVKR